MKKNYIEAMRQWGQRFGDIYGLYFGRGPVVVIADANVFEQVMVKQQSISYNRPKIFVRRSDSRCRLILIMVQAKSLARMCSRSQTMFIK